MWRLPKEDEVRGSLRVRCSYSVDSRSRLVCGAPEHELEAAARMPADVQALVQVKNEPKK